MWYGIGMLQYHFLVAEGLRPEHKFMDIACGSLRLGQYLIPYLDERNYFGIDAEQELIDLGLEHEIPEKIKEMKKPIFDSNYVFDFDFADSIDYAMAQSLFTHLIIDDIRLCIRNLKKVTHKDTKFYYTFFEGESAHKHEDISHANRNWNYSQDELRQVSEEEGWTFNYIGDWNHPRNQKMVLLTL